MQTPQEIYRKVVTLYDNRESDETFASSIVHMFMLEASDYYEKKPHDELVTWIFNNCVNICDGENAYPKRELEIYWGEIVIVVNEMRTKM